MDYKSRENVPTLYKHTVWPELELLDTVAGTTQLIAAGEGVKETRGYIIRAGDEVSLQGKNVYIKVLFTGREEAL